MKYYYDCHCHFIYTKKYKLMFVHTNLEIFYRKSSNLQIYNIKTINIFFSKLVYITIIQNCLRFERVGTINYFELLDLELRSRETKFICIPTL